MVSHFRSTSAGRNSSHVSTAQERRAQNGSGPLSIRPSFDVAQADVVSDIRVKCIGLDGDRSPIEGETDRDPCDFRAGNGPCDSFRIIEDGRPRGGRDCGVYTVLLCPGDRADCWRGEREVSLRQMAQTPRQSQHAHKSCSHHPE